MRSFGSLWTLEVGGASPPSAEGWPRLTCSPESGRVSLSGWRHAIAQREDSARIGGRPSQQVRAAASCFHNPKFLFTFERQLLARNPSKLFGALLHGQRMLIIGSLVDVGFQPRDDRLLMKPKQKR